MAIGGVLFDIDGVLVTSWKPIPGAAEALEVLAEHQVARSYLTNTTTRTRQQIAAALSQAGMDVRPDEVITAAIVPSRADEARAHWGVENNIYQLAHRGYTAVAGGAPDCPYTFMQDLVKGDYRLPWEDSIEVTDGRSYGFEPLPR